MRNDAPMFGQYVKLNKTGEILKFKGLNPTTHMVDIELQTGAISTVHRNAISSITANEEVDFLSTTKKPN
jgi:hypothetical protein